MEKVNLYVRWGKTLVNKITKIKIVIDPQWNDECFSFEDKLGNSWYFPINEMKIGLGRTKSESELTYGKIDLIRKIINKDYNFIITNTRNISLKLRYSILMRDNSTCQICGRTISDGVKLQIDHIKPFSKGGLTEYNNLRVLCFECNMGKFNSYTGK